MARAGEARVDITAATDGLKTGVASALRTLKSTFVPSAQTAMRAFAAATTAAFGASIVAAARFEEQLSKVGSLLGDQEKNVLPKFAKGVRKLALETGQATASLANGLFDIVSAGVKASEALNVLEESAKLAVAGFTSTDAATSALITTLQIFKGEITDAADAADFLFAVQKGGRLTVEQVSKNLGKFAAVGVAAGISARDLGAAFATISLSGEGAERSATQLQSILITLSKDQEGMAKRAREVGLEINFQMIKTKGLLPFLFQFQELSGQNRAQIFKETEALKGLNVILGASTRATEIQGIITDRAGLSAQAYARRADEVSFQFERFKTFAFEAAVAFGIELEPAVKDFFELIEANKDEALKFVKDFGKGIREWIEDFKSVVKAIREMIRAIGELKKTIGEKFGRLVGGIAGGLAVGLGGAEVGELMGGAIGGIIGRGGPGAVGRAPIALPGADAAPLIVTAQRGKPGDAPGTPSKFEKDWQAAFVKVRDNATDMGDTIASVMSGLQSALSQGFQDVFVNIAEGGKNFGEVMKGIGLAFRNLMFKIIGEILAKFIIAKLAEIALERKAVASSILGSMARAKAAIFASFQAVPFGLGIPLGLAAVGTVIALMTGFLKFARGGIVPGIGTADVVPAMLAPGEIVLNKAQQMALLTGGAGGGGGSITVNISGMFLEADQIKWQKLVRNAIIPELDRHGAKTRRTSRTIL